MARKKTHHRLKPEVNKLTYIILGAVFIILTLAIILSIDTKNQKFSKAFDLDKHDYKVVDFKKANKDIAKDKNVLVIFNVQGEEGFGDPTLLIHELQDLYSKNENYPENDLSAKVKKIYYVEVTSDESEDFFNFITEHKVVYRTSQIMLLYFENNTKVGELNMTKQHGVHPEGNVAKRNMIENLKEFLVDIADNLNK